MTSENRASPGSLSPQPPLGYEDQYYPYYHSDELHSQSSSPGDFATTSYSQFNSPGPSPGHSPGPSPGPSRPLGFPNIVVPVMPNRKRASRPKVRTGCVTCKARHVRCDERKPTCLRCEKANVPCAGYVAPVPPNGQRSRSKSRRRDSSKPRAVLPLQAIRPALVPACFSDRDIVYFDLFRHSLVEDLSGYLHGDFWSRVVLSESTRDECVQHGILALGALSRAIFQGANAGSSPRGSAATGVSAAPLHPCIGGGEVLNEHHDAAIHHQNQAINLCLRRIDPKSDCMSPRALLINTLLLLAFELLQGNMTGADGLMTTGIRLLRNSVPILRETVPSTDEDSAPAQTPRLLMVPDSHDQELADMEHMLPYLSVMSGHTLGACAPQLRLYSNLISCPNPTSMRRLGPMPPAQLLSAWGRFHTHAIIFGLQARGMHTGPVPFHLEESGSPPSSAHQPVLHDPVQVEMERVRFLAGLGHWREVILEARERAAAGSDARTRRALRLVHMQYLATLIDASSCRDVSDMAYDHFEPEFRELLRLCGECVAEAEREPVSKIGFTFEGGSIASPLTLIASKCRRREVRLKAVSLSKRLSWREGAWDAKALLCAVGVVVLEEEARNARGIVEAKDRVRWCGVTWDRERRLVVGDYIHVLHVPDAEGGMRTRRVALDVDRWEPETIGKGKGKMPVALSAGAGGSSVG